MSTPPPPGGIDFSHVDDLVDTIRSAGTSADVDPGKITLPGVWVQVTQIELERLAGYTFVINLALIVGDTNVRRTMTKLAELHNRVRSVIPYQGPAVARTYVIPANPTTPLPGLAVPFNLRIKESTP